MAKRLNYEIGFTGDTSQLKAAISGAVSSLQQLSTTGIGQLTPQLQQASNAAMQLSMHMQAAMNPNTGKFDLTMLNASLKKSKMSLTDYATQLKALGPEGERAFLKTANAIMQAEVPTKRLKGVMGELWTVMKNTMRWQLTSSMLHGFIGSVQTALSYVKDLDESLNNIRIVSGKSANDMAKFSVEANKAAKALHTTTNEYAKASLIYFQQGLNDAEIKERTEATIKMANVTNQSAEIVSDQMTAIWNNFDDGSKSLEYYADVLTALGAKTASSTDEIAQGLEKFAGVTGAIGLSYEYATAALATVTAETRQSADIVGTAFKTLFARIQGLKLGEALEDGTTLNKYSEALDVAGVKIYTQNGALKDMDVILDELGDKWQTLTKDQQVALAQTVAGVRQYTQLITLMDNWDTFEVNLGIAKESEGELKKQADVFAESWEAARNKVKASAEDIYDSLINSQGFIDLNNDIAPVLDRIADMVDALGGLKGVLVLIGSVATSVFQKQMASGLRNVIAGTRDWLGLSQKQAMVLKQDAAKEAGSIISTSPNRAIKTEIQTNSQMAKIQETIYKNQELYNNSQLQSIKSEQQIVELLKEQTIESQKRLSTAETIAAEREGELLAEAQAETVSQGEWQRALLSGDFLAVNANLDLDILNPENIQQFESMEQHLTAITSKIKEYVTENAKINSARNIWKNLGDKQKENLEIQKQLARQLNITESEFDQAEDKIKLLEQALMDSGDILVANRDAIRALSQVFRELNVNPQVINHFTTAIENLGNEGVQTSIDVENLERSVERLRQEANTPIPNPYDWADGLTAVSNAFMNVSMAMQALQNFDSIWSNEDLSTAEKWTQTLMSIAMIAPIAISAIKGLVNISRTLAEAQNSASASTVLLTGAQKAGGVSGLFLAGVNKIVAATGWSAVAAMGALLGILAGAAVIITLVVVGIKGLINAIHAQEKEAKNAKRTFETLSDAYATATERAKNFKEAISDYHEGINQLDQLKKGTEEYNEALDQTNEKTLDLIEKFGLYDSYYRDENGQLLLDEGALANKQAELEAAQGQAEIFKNASQLRSNVLNGQVDSAKLSNEIRTSGAFGHYRWIKEDENGEIVRVSGEHDERNPFLEHGMMSSKDLDDIISALGDMEIGASSTEALTEKVMKDKSLVDQLALSMGRFSTATSIEMSDGETREMTEDDKQKIKEFDVEQGLNRLFGTPELKDSLSTYIEAQKEAAAAAKHFATQAMKLEVNKDLQDEIEVFATNEKGEVDYGLVDAIKGAVAGAVVSEEEIDEKVSAIDTSNISKASDVGYDNVEALAQTYAKNALGIINASISQEGEKYVITDNITQQTHEFTEEQLAQAYKFQQEYQKIMREVEQSEKDVFNVLQGVIPKAKEAGQQYGVDFTSALLTSIEQGSETFNFADLLGANKLDSSEITDLLAKDPVDITAMFGGEEQLKKVGFDSAVDFSKKFKEGIEKQQITNLSDKLFKGEVQLEGIDTKKLKGDKKASAEMAAAMVKYANAVDVASKKLKTWKTALVESNKNTPEYTEALEQATSAMSGLLGISEEEISPAFVTTNLDAFEKAVAGDTTALFALKLAAETGITADTFLNNEQFTTAYQEILSALDNPEIKNLDINATIQDQNLYNSLQDILNATNMTVDEATAKLSEMGYDAEVTSQPIEDSSQTVNYEWGPAPSVKVAGTVTKTNGDGETYTATYYDPGKLKKIEETTKTTQTASSLKITSLKKNANWGKGGNIIHKNMPAIRNAASTSPKSTKDTGTIDPGGGGGSTKKSPEPKKIAESPKSKDRPEKEEIEDTVDIYQDINNELEEISNKLDRVSEKTDRSWGTEKLQQYKNALAELNNQYDTLVDKQIIAKDARDTSIQELKDFISKNNLGVEVKTDEKGNVTNWAEIATARDARINKYNETAYYAAQGGYLFDVNVSQLPEYTEDEEGKLSNAVSLNAFVQQYTPGYAEISTKEDWDTWYDNYKEYYVAAEEDNKKLGENFAENFDKLVENAQNHTEKYLNTTQEVYDNQIQTADKTLEEFLEKYEQIYSFKELENSAREFFKSIEEWSGKTLKSSMNSLNYDAETALSTINELTILAEEYNGIMSKIDNASWFDSTADFRARQQEILEDMMSKGEDLLGFLDSYSSMLIDSISIVQEEMDKFTQGLEHSISVLDSYREISTLIGKANGRSSSQIANQEISMMQKQLSAQRVNAANAKKEFEIYSEAMQKAEIELKKYESDMESANYKIWKQNYETAKAAAEEAEQEMLAATAESMQMAQEIYLLQIDKFLTEMEKAFTEGKGFEFFRTVYDNMIKEEERYLDAVNKSYELTKLNSELQKSIDDANSLSASNTLKALKDEVALREKNGKLTQYDVDILRAKYEVTKAQIALEEAQNNKSSMRLTRNSQGNWDYVFSANQDEIDKAQENYNSAVNDYYNLAKNKTKETAERLVALRQETADSLRAILEDDTLTQEQKNKQIEELWRVTEEEINYLNGLMKTSTQDMSDAGSLAVGDFESSVDELVRYAKIDLDDFETTYRNTVEDAKLANTEFQTNVNGVADEVGLDFDTLRDKAGDVAINIGNIEDSSEKAARQLSSDLSAVTNSAIAYGGLAEKIWAVVNAQKELVGSEVQGIGQDLGQTVSLGATKDFTYSKDYTNDIIYLINNGYSINDPLVQQMFKDRQTKIDLEGLEGSVMSNEELKRILTTDFSALIEDMVLGNEFIDGKLAQKIQQALKDRMIKIELMGLEDQVVSNDQLYKELGFLQQINEVARDFGLSFQDIDARRLSEEQWNSIYEEMIKGATAAQAIAMSGQFDSWEHFLEAVTGQDITRESIQSNTYHINLDNINVQDGTEFIDVVLHDLPMRAQQETSTNKW